MDAITAIRERRTIKTFTGAGIPRARIEELVELARCAPNHRLTQPWRFYAIDQTGVGRLVAHIQTPALGGVVEARKLPAIAERLALCGAVVQVTCVISGGEEQQREDRDATCAAVQNLLIAAQAAGLGSFWSTSPLFAHPEVLRWFGADSAAERHVGAIWLGVPTQQPPVPPRRPLAEVLRWA
jgi:nitroreductase